MESTLISQAPARRHVLNRARRAAWGSFAGAVVDWYDFLLMASPPRWYLTGSFSANQPGNGYPRRLPPSASVSFRPLGVIIFGHFGDRLGRKRMPMMTVWMMRIATACIGLAPFNQIGWWA